MVSAAVDGDPWIHRSCLKDSGKIRSTERYWHPCTENFLSLSSCAVALGTVTISKVDDNEHDSFVVLPDATCLRKYLRLFKHLLTNTQGRPPLSCVLLESVVEYMDYRNQAPLNCGQHDGQQVPKVQGEMASPQERSTLQQLMREGKVIPFCDLSVREGYHSNNDFDTALSSDEWNWLSYESLTMEERSQHALARAARLILEHQQGKHTKMGNNGGGSGDGRHPEQQKSAFVIILVDEVVIAERGRWNKIHLDDGIQVQRLETFVRSLVQQQCVEAEADRNQEQLLHLLQVCESEYLKRNPTNVQNKAINTDQHHDDDDDSPVQEYWPDDRVAECLRKGLLLQGRLSVTKENPKEAFVRADGKHWFIDARSGNHNRAMDQDMVAILPLPEEKWGRPVGKRRLVFSKDGADDDEDDLALDDFTFPAFPSARVVAIQSVTRRSFVASMVDIPLLDESAVLVVPMDIRIPKIRVPTRTWQKMVGMRLLVQVDGWDVGSNYPHGHITEVLGPMGDMESEVKCLLLENQVRLDPFSVAACACLPKEGAAWNVDSIPESELLHRRDLRQSHRIFSVDPIGCQDIDDTMHARYLPNGDIEIGVHIADVTWFVPLNSALDREARIRATTFYLVDRRFDMLPGLLSSNLCSLHDNTDRLAVSVIWTLSPDLQTIKSTWFGKTVIHNVAAMTYEQAANILEGIKPEHAGQKPPPPLTAGSPVRPDLIPHLKEDLSLLTKLARIRRQHRESVGGAVDLSSGDIGGELKFTLVNGKPVSVKPKQDLEIHHTIAELMIWANTSVATKIFDRFPGSSLLRIHREVEEDRFEDLKEMLSAGNIELMGKSNKELAETLKKVGSKAAPVVASLLRSLATRAMTEAQYISSGGATEGQTLSHYGLGLSFYTHFTSPIRRYADVVVHHQLMAALTEPPKSIHDNKPKLGPLHTLPDSAVVSMLTDNDFFTGADTGNATNASQLSRGVRVNTATEINEYPEPSGPNNDLEVDDLIDGADELLLGDSMKDAKAEIENPDDAYDVEIDELIGDASNFVMDRNNYPDGRSQDNRAPCRPVSGSSNSGSKAKPALPMGTPEDLEIDELIGNSEDFEIDELIGDASAIVTDVEDDTAADHDFRSDQRDKKWSDGGKPTEAVSPDVLDDLDVDQLIGDSVDALIGGGTDLVGTAAAEEFEVTSSADRNLRRDHPTSSMANEREVQITGREPLNHGLHRDWPTAPGVDKSSELPFSGDDVSTICERLNLHTRLAKQCSYDCQGLFLSLFFRDNTVVTDGVVARLKENGFEVYIPRFDFRAPVYMRDSDGYVQMDPSLLGLPVEAGEEATLGFARSKNCRRFRRHEVELQFVPGEMLAVRIQNENRLTLRPLDVVAVEIFCSDWDQRARIPSPRVHIVPRPKKSSPSTFVTEAVSQPASPQTCARPVTSKVAKVSPRTIFDVLDAAVKTPNPIGLSGVVGQSGHTTKSNSKASAMVESPPPLTRQEVLKGRIVFGNFVNPNTRMAEQLVAQEAAAAEALAKRRQLQQTAVLRPQSRHDSNIDDPTVARRVEREVTIRQQRLAKEKRESRRPKKN